MASVYQDIPLIDGFKYDFAKVVERCEFLKIPDAEEEGKIRRIGSNKTG